MREDQINDAITQLKALRKSSNYEQVHNYIDIVITILRDTSLTDSEKVELLEDACDIERFYRNVSKFNKEHQIREAKEQLATVFEVVKGIIGFLL